MRRQIATVLGAALIATLPFAAKADNKDFSISIGGPGYSINYSDGGRGYYRPRGVYVAPAPVYYSSPSYYYAPAPIYVAPRRYYGPRTVYVAPYRYGYRNDGYYGGHRGHRDHRR